MGLAVGDESVSQAADRIECGVLKAPFTYLGSIVGANMSRIQSWDAIVGKMEARLSKWKIKTLSIGGRLTLLKAVLGSMSIYHMSIFKVPMKVLHRMESIRCHFFNGIELNSKQAIWVKWNKVLAAKDRGGLGVSSLYALNRALMFKWVWRFSSQKDSLWARVIKAIHGIDGKIGGDANFGYKSIWSTLIQEMESLKKKDIDLFSYMQKKLGNGVDTSFWNDAWRGEMKLKHKFLRIYALELNKTISVADKLAQDNLSNTLRRCPRGGVESSQMGDLLSYMSDVVIGTTPDRWFWSINGSGDFSVSSVRKVIDDRCLPEMPNQTRWIKAVPIKINVLAWKVSLDCLPTRLNISRRGIDIPSILCPICDSVVESSSHLFFGCSLAKDILRRICRWWNVEFSDINSYAEWSSWIGNIRMTSKLKSLLQGVCFGANMEKYFKRKTPCTSTSDDVTKQATKEKPKQPIDVIDLNNLPWDPVDRPRISQYNVNQRDDIRRKYWNRGPCQPSGHDFKRTIIDDFGRQGGNEAFVTEGFNG
ncbi:RNA-directed DNA polymerase, eukaryota, reverse transcriptase zinc-binding domain protein [Tanacetum coccineum]